MSPLTEKIVKKAFQMGVEYAKAQLKKDAANRYSLTAEWVLPLITCEGLLPRGEYEDDVIHIHSDGVRALVWYAPYESTKENPECDGASCVPDVLFGIDLRAGAVAHDPGYRRLRKIAQAFGVAEAKVRKFLDNLFTSVVLAENDGKPGCKTVATVAHWAVRVFGGLYHKAKKGGKTAVVVTLAAISLGGCAGCVQTSFESPEDYVSPQYEKTV